MSRFTETSSLSQMLVFNFRVVLEGKYQWPTNLILRNIYLLLKMADLLPKARWEAKSRAELSGGLGGSAMATTPVPHWSLLPVKAGMHLSCSGAVLSAL